MLYLKSWNNCTNAMRVPISGILLLLTIIFITTTGTAYGDCTIQQLSEIFGVGGGNLIGQSFTATCTGNLTSIVVYPGGVAGTITNATLTIHSGQSVANSSQLYTQTVTLTARQDNTLTLNTPVSVTIGNLYTFALAANSIQLWGTLQGSNYTGGSAYINGFFGETGPVYRGTNELYFKVNISSGSPLPVPIFDKFGLALFVFCTIAAITYYFRRKAMRFPR